MRRNLIISVMTLALALAGCTDKLLAISLAVGGCRTATGVCQTGFDYAASAKGDACKVPICEKLDPKKGLDYQKCLRQDHTKNAEWIECYKPMVATLATWGKTKPLLLKAWDTADAAIKAAREKQSGQKIDYMAAIKEGVCMLTKIAPLLPQKWQDKLAGLVKMAADFGCDKTPPPATPVKTSLLLATPEQQLDWLMKMRATMAQILRSRGA